MMTSIDERIATMFIEGKKGSEIAAAVGLTAQAVWQRIKRMRYAGVDLPNPFAPKLGVRFEGVETDPRRASVMHLVDLKRAGHSPRQTELPITTERPCAPRSYATYGSIYGSPALSCAELA